MILILMIIMNVNINYIVVIDIIIVSLPLFLLFSNIIISITIIIIIVLFKNYCKIHYFVVTFLSYASTSHLHFVVSLCGYQVSPVRKYVRIFLVFLGPIIPQR